MQLAAARGKPVLLDLYADWCVACKEFEHKTFSAPAVRERFGQMVLLQADVTANDDADVELLNSSQCAGAADPHLLRPRGQGADRAAGHRFYGAGRSFWAGSISYADQRRPCRQTGGSLIRYALIFLAIPCI